MKAEKAAPPPEGTGACYAWTQADEIQWQVAHDTIRKLKDRQAAYKQALIEEKLRNTSVNFLEYAADAVRNERYDECSPKSIEIGAREHFSSYATVKVTMRVHKDLIDKYDVLPD